MESDTRANLRRHWINILYEFSSERLQFIWVQGDAKIVVSFTECMCGYFDDLNLGAGLECAVQEGWLSLEDAEAVAVFHQLADEYQPPPRGDANILRDPHWIQVRRAAQMAWLKLRPNISDASEQRLIEDLEQRWGEISISEID